MPSRLATILAAVALCVGLALAPRLAEAGDAMSKAPTDVSAQKFKNKAPVARVNIRRSAPVRTSFRNTRVTPANRITSVNRFQSARRFNAVPNRRITPSRITSSRITPNRITPNRITSNRITSGRRITNSRLAVGPVNRFDRFNRANRIKAGAGPVMTPLNRAAMIPTGLTRNLGRPGGQFAAGNLGRNAGNLARTANLGRRIGNATLINRRRVTIFRDARMFWRGNAWVRLVAIGALGAVVVGGAQYYPDGYVVVPRPACGGITPEGCSLRWQAVPTMDGGSEAQCVQFCPQGRGSVLEQQAMGPPMSGQPMAGSPMSNPPMPGPGPVQPVAGPVQQPPAMPPGGQGCEVAVFTSANFGGQSVRTNDSQPNLNEQWDRQILSVQVVAGTWDFFKGEDFSGEAMRLPPGQYGDLGPTWARQISSFMCSEPAQ